MQEINRGILSYLTGEPLSKKISESDSLANEVKIYLGENSFGNPDEETKFFDLSKVEDRKRIDEIQLKEVPKLNLPDIIVDIPKL